MHRAHCHNEFMRPLHTGFAVSVDLVVLTVVKGTLCALLFTRDSQPYQGRPALPGNFVAHDEGLASAAWRRLNAETGLSSTQVHLEQLASYGSIDRDPRGRVVTIGYLALLPSASIPRQKPSGAVARWNPVEPLLEEATALAFDHHKILTDGVERARAKLEYSSLAAEFCPPQFTIATLRRVYEAVWGAKVDPRNFHRKVTGTPGFVTPTSRSTGGERGRPARLYTKGPATSLHPPLLRR